MAKIESYERYRRHWCPACDMLHYIAVDKPGTNGAQWKFDAKTITFDPSVDIKWHKPELDKDGQRIIARRCHYFIENGEIRYRKDSTHELKGQTVPLPELPADE